MNEFQTLARLERQMNDAPQLRAESFASGCAWAIDGLSSVLRGTMLRLRGPQEAVAAYLQRWMGAYDRSSRI